MPAYPATAQPAPDPVKKAARLANGWGWSYLVTILGAFGAGYVQPGPLRVLLLNFGILCFVIGGFELYWRHRLVTTRQARWARMLALNQVGGTLALMWSFSLLYQVPDSMLADYSKKSDLWARVMPMIKAMDITHTVTDTYVLHMFHNLKLLFVFGLGAVTLLSQIWVIRRYRQLARAIEQTPSAPIAVPPLL
jgi:hypothetical protein